MTELTSSNGDKERKQKMGGIAFDLFPHKCKQCGKKFEAAKEWSYKLQIPGKGGGKYWYFCTWHCLQGYRKQNSIRKDRNTKK